MAIDERPFGNGDFILGTRFGKEGTYTISLDSKDAEGYNAYLIDMKTGVTTDLTIGNYEFSSENGVDEERFIFSLNSRSGIASVASEDIKVNMDGNILSVSSPETIEMMVVTIDGKKMVSTRNTELQILLPVGIYLVKAGNKVVKVNSGK